MAFDASYNTLVYVQQGGSRLVVGSGGVIEIVSGGSIEIDGSLSIASGGSIEIASGGSIDVASGGSIDVASGGAIGIASGASIDIASGGSIDVVSGGAIDIASGGSIDVASGGAITVASGGAIDTAEAANANVVGVSTILHEIDIADGAGDTDVVLTNKTRILDIWAVKTAANGGAGDTVTAKNGANAISSAIDLNVTDGDIARTTSIDDAYHEIAASGTLKITAANNTDNECIVYVLGVRVA